MTAAERAARAALGSKFRGHGRDPAFGLDCVGLAALAIRAEGHRGAIPASYALRGGDAGSVLRLIDATGLARADPPAPGNLMLFHTGPAQFHLAIAVAGGMIHADAMLRRVVERPGTPPWPMIAAWRSQGE